MLRTAGCLSVARRGYGYFVLPILHRGRLVGRLDAKARRGEGVFDVGTVYLEEEVDASVFLVAEVARAILGCARWHRTPRVRVGRCRPTGLARPLCTALRERE